MPLPLGKKSLEGNERFANIHMIEPDIAKLLIFIELCIISHDLHYNYYQQRTEKKHFRTLMTRARLFTKPGHVP